MSGAPHQPWPVGHPVIDRDREAWGTVVYNSDDTITAWWSGNRTLDITDSRYGPPDSEASYWVYPREDVDRLREALRHVRAFPAGWNGVVLSVRDYIDAALADAQEATR